jgi:type I restriction enzyme M protein
MLGAIIGDIAGSRFEFNNYKAKDFQFLHSRCKPTDDSLMTLAVAEAILSCKPDRSDLPDQAVRCMQEIGRRYPHAGYGNRFSRWLELPDPRPYGSFGNGAAMRVSPCGFAARDLEDAKMLSKMVTAVTHNHPEGLKGAEAAAVAVYLARTGKSMSEIREVICKEYYPLDFTLDEIRPGYSFDVSCQGSLPPALEAFFESTDYEDTIRNAISIGGDSDTLAAIAGGIAEAYYGIPAALREKALAFLYPDELRILTDFEKQYPPKIL